jgi:hypothetical protein
MAWCLEVSGASAVTGSQPPPSPTSHPAQRRPVDPLAGAQTRARPLSGFVVPHRGTMIHVNGHCRTEIYKAAARAPRCAGGQARATAPSGPRKAARRLGHAGGAPAGAGGRRLAAPAGVCGPPPPHHPPACGGRWAAREPPRSGRGRRPPPAGRVQRGLEVLLTARLLAPGVPAVWTDPGDGLGPTVGALSASPGGGTDGSGVDLARGVAVSGATVAAARRGVSTLWWGEAARCGGLSRRRTSARLASQASPGVRGPRGGHTSPLVYTFLP